MPFASRTSISKRRPSFAPEETEILASTPSSPMQASASTSWINPFSRASFSAEDDTYVPPSSLPSSRRPSAATIISTLLHGGKGAAEESSDDAQPVQPVQVVAGGRRPSAILRAWKGRRGSHSQSPSASPAPPAPVFAQGRRKSSALTRVLQPSALRNNTTTSARVDEHSLSASDSDTRRRSLSIVCRGDRESVELDAKQRSEYAQQSAAGGGAKTAAMAIRDTWLYSEHQWERNGRKGSVSTVATSPSYSVPRKSFAAVGLDEEREMQEERVDARSVVSLSLTEEIALYTADAGKSKEESVPNGVVGVERRDTTFSIPDWDSRRGSALPMLSPAPAVMIADPFDLHSAAMQRVESGAVDPMLSAVHTPTSEGASAGHGSLGRRTSTAVQWATPQWNVASPFNPDASSRRTSFAATSAYHSIDDDQSPTAPNFPPPPAIVQPTVEERRRATTYYDASPLPIVDEIPRSPTCEFPLPPSRSISTITKSPRSPRSPRSPLSPKSPKSFGHSETYQLGALQRRASYSIPRPPAGYASQQQQQQQQQYDDDASSHVPTPRLVGLEFGETAASPMSSNFEPETPSGGVTFPELLQEKRQGGGAEEDLHAQFCSVLLLDLGDGKTMRLSESEEGDGAEERRGGDPFALLAF